MSNKRAGILVSLLALVLVFGCNSVLFGFSGNGSGTSNDPYEITDWGELDEVRNDISAYYELMNDLDSGTTGYDTYASSTANSDQGWEPIGEYGSTDGFTGSFDGQGYTISDLCIDRDSSGTGLFGGTNGATIENVGLISVDISGKYDYFGGLVGDNRGTIKNCFVTGSVSVSNASSSSDSEYAGGLVGYNTGDISKSYTDVSVTGQWNVGGLVGKNSDGSISNSYSSGSVSGVDFYGGLVGEGSDGSVTSSFWDVNNDGISDTSSGDDNYGATGKSTAEMTEGCTFMDAGWNFASSGETGSSADGTWTIDESSSNDNSGYPALAWQGMTNSYDSCVSAPAVTNRSPDYESTTATLNGEVTDTGGEDPTVTIYWGDNEGDTTSGNWDNSIDKGTQSGTFSSDISSLNPNTTYYYRCYADNSGGSDWADSTESFTTDKKELTIDGSFTANDKTYDGTTDATIANNNLLLSGVLSGDDVTLTNVVVAFAASNVADGITVNISSAEITGTDDDNYTLSLSGAPTTTANITEKELTVSGASADNKDYDGTTDATISGATLEGVVSGDNVDLNNSTGGTFDQSDVGTGIAVSNSMSISGTDAGNYTLTQPTGFSADITKKELTVTADNKERDYGESNPTFTLTYSGFVTEEDKSVLGTEPSASCSATETSPAKDYDITVSGGSDDNYSFNYVTGTLTVNGIKPTVTTKEVTNVKANTADGGGNVSSDGGEEVTARGVCWSTNTNPTISDDHTTDGTGTGEFDSEITGMTTDTKYYLRAYATNSVDTSYGDEKSFTTNAVPDEPTNPSPTHEATNVSTSPTLEVDVSDDDGDDLTVTFYDASDDSQIGSNKTVTGGGGTAQVDWSGLNNGETYDWYVEVSDGSATTTSDTWSFTTNYKPTADFEYSPTSPIIGEEIEFSASGSSDPDGSIASYSWDWRNDGSYDGNSETATHTYTDPGTYTVKLQVEDDDGATDSTTKDVEVKIGAVDEISVVASSQVLPSGAEAAAGTNSAASSSNGGASTTLTATAKNSVDYPVRDATVNFSSQYGTLSSSSAITDISGKASVTLTAPNEPSTSTIKATAEDKPAATSVYFEEEGGPEVKGSKSEVLISGQRSTNIDAKAETGVEAEVRKTESSMDEEVAATVAEFEDNPKDKKALDVASGGYLEANVDKPEKLERMRLKFHLDPWPSEPRVKFWDETEGTWVTIDTKVFPDEGYIQATIDPDTEPHLSSLSGLKLAAGGLDVEYIQVENEGWTMVSPPLNPEKGDYSDPTYVFKELDTTNIYHWDPTQKSWLTPEDGYKLAPFSGNWVWAAETDVPETFSVAGVYKGDVTITLENPGWHQVGPPMDYNWSDIGVTKEGEETMTVAGQSSGPSAPHWMSRFIWSWDPDSKTYSAHDPRNSSLTLQEGMAYWVRTREENVKLKIPHNAPPPTPSTASGQSRGIPMDSQRADKLDIPNPPAPPTTLSVGEFSINATPNPLTSKDQVTFIAAGSNLDSFRVNVYDASGKTIHASRRQLGHTYTWKPEGSLSNGLYLYQVTARKDTGKTLTETGKLLVLK